ncbi:MAG TPA: hypothetical protein VKV69_10665 [Actinomycetota bacterium]|nr:hypothetical protein [Actinomycetota bacterium]
MTVKVVVVEHGREFVHTVAEAPSLNAVRDVLERLRAYFGDGDGRIQIVSEARIDGRVEGAI